MDQACRYGACVPGEPTFRDFDPEADRVALIALLTGEEWTHRARPVISEAEATDELGKGAYAGDDVVTVVIELDGEVVGFVRADGLASEREDPQLDFRLREPARGRGIGLAALGHITDLIFFRHRAEGDSEPLADVVHQTVMYYQDRLSGQGFSRAFAGGRSRLPAGIDAAVRDLESRLGVVVEPLDPTVIAPLVDRISVTPRQGAALASLVGMLLRSRKEAVAA